MKYKKGTFVIIPNKDKLRGKPSEMQSIYFWLCEHANNTGGCFPTKKTLMDEAGCSHNTLDKYLAQLVSDGFLSVKNRHKKGTNELTSNYYQILIVPENPKMGQPTTNNGLTGTPKNGLETVSNINSNQITTISTKVESPDSPFKVKTTPLIFSYGEELNELRESEEKYKKIIALFFMRKGWKFENRMQYKTAYKRVKKSAEDLEGYNSEQLTKAFEYCEDNYGDFNWGLETCIKIMPKIINE